jgi:hypothetical protein
MLGELIMSSTLSALTGRATMVADKYRALWILGLCLFGKMH